MIYNIKTRKNWLQKKTLSLYFIELCGSKEFFSTSADFKLSPVNERKSLFSIEKSLRMIKM